MDISLIKDAVKDAYGIEICFIQKIKNVYKLQSDNKAYCLKVINYNYNHFMFIISAIKHLQYNGFNKVPEIIDTKTGYSYICIFGKYAYLTEWLNCRQCNYENPVELFIAASTLGELHIKSQGFKIDSSMKPRVGWLRWIQTFKIRRNEIFTFKEKIIKKNEKTEFDYLFLKGMSKELEIAESSIINLCRSDYIQVMKEEIGLKGFCHHDYAHHNVLIDKNEKANIIDFDYCILDSHLHDLCSLMIRKMKNSKWDIKYVNLIIEAYSKNIVIEDMEIPIMAAFIEFPQDYWQLGIQYYWEEKDWEEKTYVNKLSKIYEDNEEKLELLDDLKRIKL